MLYKGKAYAHLHLRSPLAEVDAAVKKNRGNYTYAKDDVFGEAVLRDVVTYPQGMALIAMLNADRYAMEGHRQFTCQKASSMRRSLDYWKKSAFLLASVPVGEFIASARRTCCSCHELGSFALDARCIQRTKELQEKKKAEYDKKNPLFPRRKKKL